MKTFRQTLFWAHLAAGLTAGAFIAIMCFTGTALAFQDEIVARAERDARRVTIPPDGERLAIGEMQKRLRAAHPDFRPTNITMQNDPAAAIAFSSGRDATFYVDPYSGAVRQPASTKTAEVLRTLLEWHRFLGRDGDQRPAGKLINGVCNIVFCVLAITGLYLWWPRSLSWRSVRAVAIFNWQLAGKARDFNWHNVVGLWSAPILIVLTLTAVPISFRWGGDAIYRLVGEEPPAPGGAPAVGATSAAPALEIKRPSLEARPLSQDAMVVQVQQAFPRWQTITLRTGAAGRGPRPNATPTSTAETGRSSFPASESTPPERRSEERAPGPMTIVVKESRSWPRTATTTLTLNPFTGEELKREGFGDFSTGRRVRAWTRFLHTGQALGPLGQFVAGLACLGGCFLVYTGFALSWRRFFGRKPAAPATEL